MRPQDISRAEYAIVECGCDNSSGVRWERGWARRQRSLRITPVAGEFGMRGSELPKKGDHLFLVPGAGLEPARPFGQRISRQPNTSFSHQDRESIFLESRPHEWDRLFLLGSGGRISPYALRAPVALAADRDASASLRLRVNLLLCSFAPCPRKQKAGPLWGPAFLFGSGGVICTVPTACTRIRLK